MMITHATAQLDWQAFTARYFPQRRRHDFEVLKAYEAYRSSSLVTERRPSEGEASSRTALQVWEEEGGAVQAIAKERPAKQA